jgi:hypothetical protein
LPERTGFAAGRAGGRRAGAVAATARARARGVAGLRALDAGFAAARGLREAADFFAVRAGRFRPAALRWVAIAVPPEWVGFRPPPESAAV